MRDAQRKVVPKRKYSPVPADAWIHNRSGLPLFKASASCGRLRRRRGVRGGDRAAVREPAAVERAGDAEREELRDARHVHAWGGVDPLAG